MTSFDELDIDEDAKQVMEEVAEEMGFNTDEIRIPESKLKELFEMFDEDKFREAMKQTFKQLSN